MASVPTTIAAEVALTLQQLLERALDDAECEIERRQVVNAKLLGLRPPPLFVTLTGSGTIRWPL